MANDLDTAQPQEGSGRRLLDWLLAPSRLEEFTRHFFDRRPFHASGRPGDYYAALTSVEELQEVVALLPAGCVGLAYDGVALDEAEYVSQGSVLPQQVRALQDAGATLILRSVHRWLPRIASLTGALGHAFDAPAQTNVYLSPPGPASTPPHWDTHDIFVLQIAGRKVWNFYDCDYTAPLIDERFDAARWRIGEVATPLEICAGDLFYMPRGTVHHPEAREFSVHLAVGVHVERVLDRVTSLLGDAATRTTALRRAAAAATPQDVAAVLEDLARQLRQTSGASRAGLPAPQRPPQEQGGELTSSSVVQATRGVAVRGADGELVPTLRGSGELRSTSAWLRALAQNRPVAVRELGEAGMSDEDRLRLAGLLIQEGYVTPVQAPAPPTAVSAVPGADRFERAR